MSVEAIRLKNFMPFADTGWIEFRPITLFFGRNSSGKSAIIRALRLVKQSLNSEQPLQFSILEEGDVDLGSYARAVHHQQINRQIGFSFRSRVPTIIERLRKQLNELSKEGKILVEDDSNFIEFHLAYGWNKDIKQVEIREVAVNLDLPNQANSLLFAATKLSAEDSMAFKYDWQIDSDFEEIAELDWSLATIKTERGILPLLADFDEYNSELEYTMSQLLNDLGKEISAYFERFAHIGPLRPEPQRVYFLDNQQRQRWQQQGWGAYLDLLDNKLSATDIEEINQWLRHLNLGYKLKDQLQFFSDEAVTVTRLEIIPHKELDEIEATNLVDLGSGVAQILPIMCHLVSSQTTTSLSAIEQPELHLHAEAQGMLADFFITAARQGKKFLIETHSEHLLLRLQRRIAETHYEKIRSDKQNKPESTNDGYSLGKQEFGLLFVTRSNIASHVEFIGTDNYGQLIEPSEGFQDFFRYDYDDVEKLMESVIKIKKQESFNDNNN